MINPFKYIFKKCDHVWEVKRKFTCFMEEDELVGEVYICNKCLKKKVIRY